MAREFPDAVVCLAQAKIAVSHALYQGRKEENLAKDHVGTEQPFGISPIRCLHIVPNVGTMNPASYK